MKYSLIDWTAAQTGVFKAPLAARRVQELTSGRLRTQGVVSTAAGFVAGLPYDYRLPLAISAVDMYEARWEIQDALPGYVVNAGIDGTMAEVSVHGFGDGPCLACLVVSQELESWNAGELAARVGLPLSRVHQLIQGNLGLQRADLDHLRSAGLLPATVLHALDSFEGEPLLTLWNRAAYAESPVTTGSGRPVNVTSAFVSAFAGLLLLVETIKRTVPELQAYQVQNSYRQQLLGVPSQALMMYPRDTTGHCLCHSGFRRHTYSEKYGTTSSTA